MELPRDPRALGFTNLVHLLVNLAQFLVRAPERFGGVLAGCNVAQYHGVELPSADHDVRDRCIDREFVAVRAQAFEHEVAPHPPHRYASLAELPQGAVVGTSSLRRESQLRARFPHLKIEPLRGNVQTRLRKLDEGKYAAIILAAAGLKRLGLGERIRNIISSDDSLPAVGQGALGIECRDDRGDLAEALAPLHHHETAACVLAERAMSRKLGGSCQVPLGGFAEVVDGRLRMRGFVATPDGSRLIRAEHFGSMNSPETLGIAVAEDLLAQGAGEILAALAL